MIATKRCWYAKTLTLICVAAASALPAMAQFDPAKEAKKAIKQGQDKLTDKQKDSKPAATAGAKIVFSVAPIDTAKPANLATTFKAGDNIYALVQSDKTWRDLLGKGKAELRELEVPFVMLVDGERADFQYITIKKPEPMDAKHFVLDIAPEPGKMVAYKDPAFSYAEGKGNRKIGPDQYTYILAALKPGKHKIEYQIASYGDVLAAGEFTIDGGDYKPYSALRDKLLAEALNVGTMPPAGMTNIQLQAEMMKLLQNAGWKNIRKLVIKDKDWWLDHASDGESPIVGRHIAAAVAAKAEDGKFFWCICTFQQPKLADGSFGALELSQTGEKKPILEENIDK
jgi:hypothetical protein